MKTNTIQRCLDKAQHLFQTKTFCSDEEKQCVGLLRSICERERVIKMYRRELNPLRHKGEKWVVCLKRLQQKEKLALKFEQQHWELREAMLIRLPKLEATVKQLRNQIRNKISDLKL